MLVLSRKVGETIVIGDAVQLKIVAIHGDKVRLGVSAPRDIPVLREELRNAQPSDRPFLEDKHAKTD